MPVILAGIYLTRKLQEGLNKMESQEAKLKKVLTLGDVMGIAIGQIIGAGIMSLTGVAIGMTGPGVVIAFVLSAILTIFTISPQALLGSALPATGGQYRYVSRLISPKVGFVYVVLYTLTQVTLALYALSFADYMAGIVPSVNKTLAAVALLTAFYLFNLFGIKNAAIVENFMVVCLLGALSIFTIFGLPRVHFAMFSLANMLPKGIKGLLTATALLSFATGGAQVIVELGGEMVNPKRDIPLTIVASTMVCGILYALMAMVASGVLPWEQVANKPLTDVANTVLPRSLFIFFMVGGAMFAVATTLNATLGWVTKGLLIACQDGWLPEKLGEVNERFGTPHWLLTLFYLVGLVPIITGMSLKQVAMLGTGLSSFIKLFPAIASLILPSKYPKEYAECLFPVKGNAYKIVATISIAVLLLQCYLLLSPLPRNILYLCLVVTGIAIVFAIVRGKALEGEGRLRNLSI